MNGRQRVLDFSDGKPVDRLPLAPVAMMFCADRIGVKYGHYVRDYRVLAEAQIRTSEEFDFDIVSNMSDPAREAAVITQLRDQAARFGFAPTLPYSPGYCGMKLTEQTRLFSLFRGATVGVSLTDDFLMRPLKSVSGLIGLGRAAHVAAAGSPCDRCEHYSCAMRR